MAACTKVAAFGALLRLFYVAFGAARWDWSLMIGIIAVLTMLVGCDPGDHPDRHQADAGLLLDRARRVHPHRLRRPARRSTSFDGNEISSVQAVLFYLVTYGFTTIGAFAVVTVVRDAGGEATHLSRWAGLGKESPIVAGVFAFFLLAMAGIPLTSASPASGRSSRRRVAGGAWPLVVVAVILSAVAAFFYARVIVLMFFSEPVGEGPVVMMPSILTTIVIAVGFAATVILGIFPGPVLDLAATAGQFIR